MLYFRLRRQSALLATRVRTPFPDSDHVSHGSAIISGFLCRTVSPITSHVGRTLQYAIAFPSWDQFLANATLERQRIGLSFRREIGIPTDVYLNDFTAGNHDLYMRGASVTQVAVPGTCSEKWTKVSSCQLTFVHSAHPKCLHHVQLRHDARFPAFVHLLKAATSFSNISSHAHRKGTTSQAVGAHCL